MMMKAIHTRRGLTLIETLAATVLLSLLISACVPIIQGSLQRLQSDVVQELDVQTLGLMVDEHLVTVDPEAMLESGSIPLIHADTGKSIDVSCRVFSTSTEDVVNHVWVAFEAGGVTILRYIVVPETTDVGDMDESSQSRSRTAQESR
jgi:prepilin-type N-terminal cleavage/methylation domain-containing protein